MTLDNETTLKETSPTPQSVSRLLLDRTRSLQLATVGESGTPHCGYTPFVQSVSVQGKINFYIFVSQLALHTRDLAVNPMASVMIIEDEADCKQIFARTRLYYECEAQRLDPEHQDYNTILDSYRERHGKMVDLLRQLPDFQLIRLMPTTGQFVMGFGKAFRLTGSNLTEFEHARTA